MKNIIETISSNEREYFEEIHIPQKNSTLWPKDASVNSIRKAIRDIFPRNQYEKSPVWVWNIESFNSFHDPRPDRVAFINKTGKDIFLKVPIKNDILHMIGRWELSRKNNNIERINMNNENQHLIENQTTNFQLTTNELNDLEEMVSIENEIEKNNFSYLVLDTKSTESNYDLGIEITIPKLAAGHENLDPQHGPNGNIETSAIEEALNYDVSKLSESTKIATIRPDADSVGAMAILELRKSGISFDENLVKMIGRSDALGLKRAKDEYPEIGVRQKELAYANSKCFEKTSLDEKVIVLKKLLTNKVEWSEIEKTWSEFQAKKESAKNALTVSPILDGHAVLVEGNHPMAFDIGYENAGIVAAFNANFTRPWIENDPTSEKWTIARYSEKEPLDIKGLSLELNELEKVHEGTGTWGGPANLLASPQGTTSRIPKDTILQTILRFIRLEA